MSVFEVLAEPNRRTILEILGTRERPVAEIVDQLGLSQPAVSKHLRILREAGLVEARVDAQRRLYRVRPEPLRAIDEWLSPYRRMWATRLDDLERHLQAISDTDILRVELSETDGETVLSLMDTFDERGKAARDGAGWHVCLDSLAAHLNGDPEARESMEAWQVVQPHYVEAFGPEAATIGPPAGLE